MLAEVAWRGGREAVVAVEAVELVGNAKMVEKFPIKQDGIFLSSLNRFPQIHSPCV